MPSLTPRLDRLEKNLLINGGFDFFQRLGTGAGPIGSSPGWSGPDRWLVNYTGTVTGTQTIQRVASNADNNLTTNSAQFAIRRNGTAASAVIQQRVESINARDLAYRTTGAFSIRVLTPISGCQVRLTVNVPTVTDNYTSVVQVYQNTSSQTIAASTWTTVTFPNITVGTGAVRGCAVIAEILIPTGTDGATLNYSFAQAMFVSGPYAQDFTPMGRTFAEELVACQRYYEKSYSLDTVPGTATDLGRETLATLTPGTILSSLKYKVTKRVRPTFSFWTTPGTINNIDVNGVDRGVDITSSNNISNEHLYNIVLNSSGTAGQYAFLHWTMDAEI